MVGGDDETSTRHEGDAVVPADDDSDEDTEDDCEVNFIFKMAISWYLCVYNIHFFSRPKNLFRTRTVTCPFRLQRKWNNHFIHRRWVI